MKQIHKQHDWDISVFHTVGMIQEDGRNLQIIAPYHLHLAEVKFESDHIFYTVAS